MACESFEGFQSCSSGDRSSEISRDRVGPRKNRCFELTEDDRISRSQIDTQSTSPSTEHKDEDIRAVTCSDEISHVLVMKAFLETHFV